MDLRQVFAANLRRFRHAKGLSQEDLADEAGVNRTYVSKLEKGGTSVGLEINWRVAALGTLGDTKKGDQHLVASFMCRTSVDAGGTWHQ
jgi:transcriptional regulator with XRE-family HTH domain